MRLNQCLYVLKDTSKIWFDLISTKFQNAGLKEMNSSPCILQRKDIIVVCHVDDLLVFAETDQRIKIFKRNASKDLILKDFGRPVSLLGIQLAWTKDAVCLKQKRLKSELLIDTEMEQLKGMVTLFATTAGRTKDDERLLESNQASKYKSIVGSLLYLAAKTRPDLCAAASMLGMQVESPRQIDLVSAKRAL